MGNKPLCVVVLLTVIGGSYLSLSCNKKKPHEPETIRYTLTVSVAEGIYGSPPAGEFTHPENDTVKYVYHAELEFANLSVLLDGRSVSADSVFVMNKDRTLEAVCERRILWRYLTPHSVYYSTPAIGDDGAIYFGSGLYTTDQGWAPGTLYALNPDGSLRWSREIGEALYSPALGIQDNIYIMDRTYTVHAFSATGSPLWKFDDYENTFVRRDMGQRTPAIGADGTVYIGGDGLYALDPLSGAKRWHVPHQRFPRRECMASPVIGRDGTIYVMIGEDSLYAIRPDGRKKWIFGFDHEDEMSFADPSIDAEGVLYLPSESDWGAKLYAVHSNGSLKWRVRLAGDRIVRGSVTVGVDGMLYLATKAGGQDKSAYLIALSASGTERWRYALKELSPQYADSYTTPSIGADGVIYVAAENGRLYALTSDGRLHWKHDIAGFNWSSPTIVADGTLYIGGMGFGANYPGMLSAVRSTSHGYAASPWPHFRHDNKNSGRFGGP
ncbi:PQQ-like beta-propeller repeat protein [bacterium]|nr:PQQ-like beta-propeller repeat protein [bacterium]